MELNPFNENQKTHIYKLAHLPPQNLSIRRITHIVLNLAQEW